MIGRSMPRSFEATLALGLACALGSGASADATPAKACGDARRSYIAPDLAVGPDGEVCLVWLAFGAAGDEVLAAVRRGSRDYSPIRVHEPEKKSTRLDQPRGQAQGGFLPLLIRTRYFRLGHKSELEILICSRIVSASRTRVL
jgi:hypothetical protein